MSGLKDKAARLDFSAMSNTDLGKATGLASKGAGQPKTAPGAMMQFANEKRSALLEENEQLKALASQAVELKRALDTSEAELRQWDDASATRRLDPRLVRPSEYANRSEASFDSAEFKLFADEIESAGGNVQPIKVRPVSGAEPQTFEIVFGHRRHRACLERGVPLLAMIESIDDRALFQEMDRENRQRADLRPYEQGEMYRKALDKGLYPSLRAMAEALGIHASNASVSIKIAKLDPLVLDAFPSRLDIQFRWGAALDEALSKDSARVKAEAAAILSERNGGAHLSPGQVLARLCGAAVVSRTSDRQTIVVGGRTVGTVRSVKGRVLIDLDAKSFPEAPINAVLDAIRRAARES